MEKNVRAAVKSGKGVRANNEDAYFLNGQYAELEEMNQERFLAGTYSAEGVLLAVCDGMGGHENGELASHAAVSNMGLLHTDLSFRDFPGAMADWVRETGAKVNRAARSGGCTLALLYIGGGRVHVAHIGDSRVYRQHGNRLTRLTKDHSKLQILLDAGMLTPEQAKDYPQKHVITRYLGMRQEEAGTCSAAIESPIPAKGRDRYLICSDGLTDVITDENISDALQHSNNVEECAEQLYRSAMEAGSKDNITVIVLEMDWDEPEFASFEETMSRKGSYEDTLTPVVKQPADKDQSTISVRQIYTVHQPNGKQVVISSEIYNITRRVEMKWAASTVLE